MCDLPENVTATLIGGYLPIDSATTQASYVLLGRGMIAAMIWIPYFLVSQRVKATFVVRRHPPPAMTEAPVQIDAVAAPSVAADIAISTAGPDT